MLKNISRLILVIMTAVFLLTGCIQSEQITESDVIMVTEPVKSTSPTSAPTQESDPEGDSVLDSDPEVELTDIPQENSDPTLRLGDENERVTALQARLIELGYLRTKATGYFGEQTQGAVASFQEKNGIEKTGVADAQTQSVLFSENAVKCPLPLAGYIIGLDPGHQSKSNSEQEPVAPGSSETKKKVSSGTEGRFTRVPEYQVNLNVALLLRDMLEEQGATVVMTRETNDVNISNVERAQFFNAQKTDYALRLHCNGTDDKSIHGAFMLVPTENPYLEQCNLAAQLLIDAYCKETGANNMGITKRSDQTGFNWCERMIVNIEMGHMTNEEEDHKLADSNYQKKMAQGLLNGILAYFDSIQG